MRVLPWLCAASSLVILVACGSSTTAPESTSGVTVSVITVATGTIEQWASLAGTFEPRDESVAAVEGAGGRVQSLAVEVGDQVIAGHEVAKLDDANVRLRLAQHTAEVARARATRAQVAAQVAEAEADAAEAGRSVERLETLAAERSVAAETIGAKRAAQLTAAARLTASQAALAAAEADEARLVTVGNEIALADTRTHVRAPVSGLVATRSVRVGQVVLAGDVVVSIAVDGVIEFAAEVPEAILAHIEPGAPVVLTSDGGTFQGQVRRVDPAVDRLTRLGAVRVALSDTTLAPAQSTPAQSSPAQSIPTYKSRIGTSARIRVRTGLAQGLIVPLSALVREHGRTMAVVIAADGIAQRVEVTIGLDDGQQVLVTSGVTPGQQVVAYAPGFVTEGARVNVSPTTGGK